LVSQPKGRTLIVGCKNRDLGIIFGPKME